MNITWNFRYKAIIVTGDRFCRSNNNLRRVRLEISRKIKLFSGKKEKKVKVCEYTH